MGGRLVTFKLKLLYTILWSFYFLINISIFFNQEIECSFFITLSLDVFELQNVLLDLKITFKIEFWEGNFKQTLKLVKKWQGANHGVKLPLEKLYDILKIWSTSKYFIYKLLPNHFLLNFLLWFYLILIKFVNRGHISNYRWIHLNFQPLWKFSFYLLPDG